ncbi:MAG: AAA family ATPase [Planctomycetes bacterium]|nr:AAA family ATPase [Planctomycetota bacterium]
MYNTHWGLEQPPFPSGTDPRLFYEGASQREALARLRFVVENRRRLGLLLSDTGLGKSLLLKVFATECRQKSCAVAQLDLLGLSSREFYWQLGTKLHTTVQPDDQPLRLFRQLADRIQENRIQDIPTVLLLDNADQAGADLLTQLLRLVHLGPADNWLTIVLTANRLQSSRLGDRLLEMVDLRIDLQPWDELDTTGYLQLALVEAGSERPLFDDQAINQIHQLADGIPRRVNRLADYALLIGSSTNQQTINSATIQTANEAVAQQTCPA